LGLFDVLVGDAYCEVSEAVAVEVAPREAVPEPVAGLEVADHEDGPVGPRGTAALEQELAARAGESAPPPVEHLHRPRAAGAPGDSGLGAGAGGPGGGVRSATRRALPRPPRRRCSRAAPVTSADPR